MRIGKKCHTTLLFITAAGILIAAAVLAEAQNGKIHEDPETLEQLEQFEILRHAKPAPTPPPHREYTENESTSAEHRSTKTYDLKSEDEEIVPTPDADSCKDLRPDEPYQAERPSEDH